MTTPRFGMDEIATGQDNILPHNNALQRIEMVMSVAVIDKDLTAPPGSPADGDMYIVGASATGAWATHDKALAMWRTSAWLFYPTSGSPGAAHEGQLAAWVKDENKHYTWNGTAWVVSSAGALAASDVANDSSVTGSTVKDALNTLLTNAANLGKRATVRAATTANVTIATALNATDVLDGVTLADGDLVLVKNQTAPAENGIYVVSGSPARFAEFDSYNEHPGALIAVQEGTANADTLWLCTSNQGGTLGTTAIVFAAFTGTINEASVADFRSNVADKVLTTDIVWSAADYVTLTDAATVAVDLATGINFTVTLGGNRTLGNPSNTKNGQTGLIEIKQDATGTRTLAYSANWKFAGGTAPVLTTAANARDLLFYQVISSTVIYGTLIKDVK